MIPDLWPTPTHKLDYIRDQERHQARNSFRDEYRRFLQRYEIERDEEYIFKPLD